VATLFQQTVDAFVANISANANVIADGALVQAARIARFQESDLPAYIVTYGNDEPLNELGPDNTRFIDWQFAIFVDCYDKITAPQLDGTFQQMRANVHLALMADVTQGQNFVLTTIPAGGDEPLLDDVLEKKTLAYRTNWIVRIRTSINDLETI